MYDIIGDIHGYADALEALLSKLGYRSVSGVWQHSERKVIFLGDFVDRGPQQVETLNIAKAMVEAGHALAVMGNHEFNAVAWASPKAELPGQFLRPHSDKNRHQHSEFLNQIGEDSVSHRQAIAWFKTLPLFLELDGIRVIHACWHTRYIQLLTPLLDERNAIRPEAWPTLCEEDSEPYEALETLLKGMEIPLPNGTNFADKDGHIRTRTRTRWWQEGHQLTYRDLAMVPPSVIEQLPHEPVPAELQPGYQGDKPLFIGHYWMSGTPDLLTSSLACLDYSIAGSNPTTAKLCAYRWQGEPTLKSEHLVWVGREFNEGP
ncbi:metallophosphoesterase [Pseudomonas aeruginosa]|uniref:metallophosphoesterase n=1 Tax=Pseudomonas aeruginosa TaxID=287 RepID=UPI0009A34AF3|nr:metallophosphoesterase [Pseudomonas aeruginosa]